METIWTCVINWSEVWALLIPLTIIILYKPSGSGIKPIILYVCIAFIINLVATIMVEFYFSMPVWLKNNNILYNIHSVVRVLCFSWYITSIRQYRFPIALKILIGSYAIFVVGNFSFLESALFISSHLFAAESIVLLIYCLFFFFRSMQDESSMNWIDHPAFLVYTGISLYEAISFFIFLFFYPLFEKNPSFGDLTMSIHNVMYVLLCSILAGALYKSYKQQRIAAINDKR